MSHGLAQTFNEMMRKAVITFLLLVKYPSLSQLLSFLETIFPSELRFRLSQ